MSANPSNANLFLSNITVVDHGYIGQDGGIYGGSFNPSFKVSGIITEDEGVVEDFSSVKKRIKAAIDHKIYGLDHKLLIVEGYSDAQVTVYYLLKAGDHKSAVKVGIIDREAQLNFYCKQLVSEDYENRYIVEVETSKHQLVLPLTAIRFIQHKTSTTAAMYFLECNGFSRDEDMFTSVEAEINSLMQEYLPEVTIDCVNSYMPQVMSPAYNGGIVDNKYPRPAFFRYVHGLKRSTSWGCQNIAHGHLSFVQVVLEPRGNSVQDEGRGSKMRFLSEELAMAIASDLNNRVFVNSDDIVEYELTDEPQEFKDLQYTSLSRGKMQWETVKSSALWSTGSDTTIENIVAEAFFMNRESLAELAKTYDAIGTLYVSEGLSKGAFINF